MADAFGQPTLAVEPFGLAHLVGIALKFVDDVAHLVKAPCGIVSDSLSQLTHAQFHVVEVGDGLAQLLGHIDQHFLEIAKGLAAVIGTLGRDSLVGDSIWDVYHHAPVAVGLVAVVGLAVPSFDELQYLAVNVVGIAGFQPAADVCRHHLDVVLQQVHVLENGVVDALEHIIGRCALGNHMVSVIDESVAQRLNALDHTLYFKLRQNAGSVDILHY